MQLESWWYPERHLKEIDGNDNSPMVLVHDDPEDEDEHCAEWCRCRPVVVRCAMGCDFETHSKDPEEAHAVMEEHYERQHPNRKKRAWWRP